jgi:CRP-like cAMP-binding protein
MAGPILPVLPAEWQAPTVDGVTGSWLDRRMDPHRFESLPLFNALPKRQREHLAQLADVVDVREGTDLTEQGRLAHEFFVIEEGTAEVSRDGRRLRELGPGDFFGEIALAGDRSRTASVRATSPMRLVVLTTSQFRTLQRDAPGVAQQLQAAIDERLTADQSSSG